jgi:hypothetical protein
LTGGSECGYGEKWNYGMDRSVRSNREGNARGFDAGGRSGSLRSRVDSRGGSWGDGYVDSSLNRFLIPGGLMDAENGSER